MDEKINCRYCASHSIRLLDALFTIRLVERPEGGGFVERKCAIYRCLVCGRQFNEVEGEEGTTICDSVKRSAMIKASR
jgi:DNA-directed RNA polymerase subunit RPC12/RpoP